MNSNKAALFVAVLALTVLQVISESVENLLEITEKCTREQGLIAGFNDDDVGKTKCFIACLYRELNAVDNEGNVIMDEYLKLMDVSEKAIGKYRGPIEKCVSLHKDIPDVCEKVVVTQECIFEATSEIARK